MYNFHCVFFLGQLLVNCLSLFYLYPHCDKVFHCSHFGTLGFDMSIIRTPKTSEKNVKYIYFHTTQDLTEKSLSDCVCILHVYWYGWVNIGEAMWIQCDYWSNMDPIKIYIFHNVTHNQILIVIFLVHVSPMWWNIYAPKLWYPGIWCNGPMNLFYFRVFLNTVLWPQEHFKFSWGF